MAPGIMVIAGSDSSGGAGISRDIETVANHGGTVRPVITAITAQTDTGVKRIMLSPPELVTAQIEAGMHDGAIKAIKIGMLGNAPIVNAVVQALKKWSGIRLVLDPVLAASSGVRLLDMDGQNAMITGLFPLVDVLTPNLPEAALLCNSENGIHSAYAQARILTMLGPRYVLIKGGHGFGKNACDELHDKDGLCHQYHAPRLAVQMRGTGCMLATALAFNLAAGLSMQEACAAAKDYVFKKLSTCTACR